MMNHIASIGDVSQIRETMQAAIAPAFLLNGIMAALAMLSVRLSRVLDRERSIRGGSPSFVGEQRGRARRAVAAHRAIFCCGRAAVPDGRDGLLPERSPADRLPFAGGGQAVSAGDLAQGGFATIPVRGAAGS
ncbi:MAG TPA: hypothetical protein VGN83_22715 [Falsiroseomonas sp.]|jgi:hypothetical protein|nr:hypothetical protein [Falsiroseomonas sp.]